jgi:hypothetical protein
MIVKDLIEKLEKFPPTKELVIFCDQDIFSGDHSCDRAFEVRIEETQYMEFNEGDIYFNMIDLEDRIALENELDLSIASDRKIMNDIIDTIEIKDVVRLYLSV